jgi:uncharacterized protein
MIQTTTIDLAPIARDLSIQLSQVETTLALLDAGNTVPFITRYRKDQTGGLDEVQVRGVQEAAARLRMLAERKQTILRSIDSQGKLTPQLEAAISSAQTTKRLDDLYLPFKPKKQTLATIARDRGLEPLAEEILAGAKSGAELDARAAEFINVDKQVPTAAEALLGAGHILAEQYSENANLRAQLRKLIKKQGKLVSRKGELDEKQSKPYADYFEYQEELHRAPPHRILAINRGERAKALRVKVEADFEAMHKVAADLLVAAEHVNAEFLKGCARDALDRLVLPSLEREIRRELTDKAEEHAVEVFARNLRHLLLQPPVAGRRLLAIDPGFRSGCKLAALDEFGKLLDHGLMHVIGKDEANRTRAKSKLARLVRKHQLTTIVIGNGTACRETEQVVSEMISELYAPPAPEAPPPEASPPQASPSEPELESLPIPLDALSDAVTVEKVEDAKHDTEDCPPVAASESTDDQRAVCEVHGVADLPSGETSQAVPPEGAPIAGENASPALEQAPPPLRVRPAPPPEVLPPPPADVAYVIVNEAGASVYSTSAIGREEFPDYDATLRGAISIGRRLLDPLSELVKIEAPNLGVGLYQHDVKAKHLRTSLDAVVESCVNYVGVDVNTASPALLQYVSGLNQLTARRLYEHRIQNGPFRSRGQLHDVPGFGDATFVQAAGFLRITGGDNPLDATWIHPESYDATRAVLAKLGRTEADLNAKESLAAIAHQAEAIDIQATSAELKIGTHLLADILAQLARPGRDPREELPPPIFKHGILKLDDLQPGMELQGTVLNVVDFGAFVDIGLHDSGLVHVSQMANRFIRDPHEVATVGDIVKVWVTNIDKERRRVGLTMIAPGTPRREEQRGRPSRGRPDRRGDRPPRPPGPQRGETDGQSPSPSVQVAPGQESVRRDRPPRGRRGPDRRPHHTPGPPFRREKPKPLVPITKAMEEGKEPMRTFGDLLQFYKKKKDEPGADDASAAT